LEIQLSTIDRRLRILDVLSVSGRDRKSEFDLVELFRDALSSQASQLEAAGVEVHLTSPGGKAVWVKAVKGQILQIIENLLSNSLHWLEVARKNDRRFKPRIDIETSKEHGGAFRFTDNGPGIAPRFREDVFGAFYTTRPAEGGKGLGLYIARENAKYHGGELFLSDEKTVHADRLNTFQFWMEPGS
jgi:signal transduction histidine kinase